MPDWSIKIVPLENPKPDLLVEFVADALDAESGSFDVEQGDNVSWNNTAAEDHWPWLVANQNAQPIGPPPVGNDLTMGRVKPDTSSDWYNVGQPTGTTLYYCCKLHPKERGRLVVVPFGHSSDDDPTA